MEGRRGSAARHFSRFSLFFAKLSKFFLDELWAKKTSKKSRLPKIQSALFLQLSSLSLALFSLPADFPLALDQR